MSTLDINTERGSLAADDQVIAASIAFPEGGKYTCHLTPMNGAAKVDGVYTEGPMLKGIFEIKSRDESLISFIKKFNWEWLLTYEKLLDLADASKMLGVPGFGILYLNKDNMVLVIKLTDELGHIVCKYRVDDDITTKATCNGGEATRVNALINVRRAKQLKG